MLGYQQSKLRYFNQTQIVDLAQRFHDEQVNVSLIVVGANTSICVILWGCLSFYRFFCVEIPRRLVRS